MPERRIKVMKTIKAPAFLQGLWGDNIKRYYVLVMGLGFVSLFRLAEAADDVNHIAHRCSKY